jgi:hypothetical protein
MADKVEIPTIALTQVGGRGQLERRMGAPRARQSLLSWL